MGSTSESVINEDDVISVSDEDFLGLDDIVDQDLLRVSLKKLAGLVKNVGREVRDVKNELKELRCTIEQGGDCVERETEYAENILLPTEQKLFVTGILGDSEFPYFVTHSMYFKLMSETKERSFIKLILEDLHSSDYLAKITLTGKSKRSIIGSSQTSLSASNGPNENLDCDFKGALPSSTISIIVAACKLRFLPRQDASAKELGAFESGIRSKITSILQYNKGKKGTTKCTTTELPKSNQMDMEVSPNKSGARSKYFED